MKVVQLSGSLRASVGKKETKAVRKNGGVPCVLYGSGEQTCFSVRSVDLEKLIFSPNVYQVELDIDGTKKMAIIQAKQMHPLTDKPTHVDFLELADDKLVKVGIPIRVTGRSKGVLNGGRLMTIFRTLKVEGLPKDLPNEVEIDITPLRIGQSIRVRDIDMPGVKTLENESAVVVSVKMSRGAVDTDEEEGEAGAEGSEEAADATEE
ncbi:50S ribosomal protein L25 [Brumimicrobium glaciale]|jgi:large subunit ribosomal protein L25|uniref:Large ribosomal subunit protein bL25 n=1 Tax=Brumimicrobium glaciale TaxID=200475 RepID=A0A4Q4KUT9_9FLAO|nr:50S ribosomal protein L25 [Brumimicrobium glaciale]RYM35884.1 50S ribosomal protein L25 [Brumimicrobium glaciale]